MKSLARIMSISTETCICAAQQSRALNKTFYATKENPSTALERIHAFCWEDKPIFEKKRTSCLVKTKCVPTALGWRRAWRASHSCNASCVARASTAAPNASELIGSRVARSSVLVRRSLKEITPRCLHKILRVSHVQYVHSRRP
jgi:hypothetical protein